VPFMEEFFWRDFLWRTIAAPADFRIAKIGEWDRGIPLLVVSLAFCIVHPQWLTAIVWGLMIGGLLIYTRSLGACIVMHAVTNFLLGAYVLYTGDWIFW
jgi:CAAX prenyl protease-like protein